MKYNKRSIKLKIENNILLYCTDLINNFSAKLQKKWIELYYIHDILSNNIYKLQTLNEKLIKWVIHENKLKFYYEQTFESLIIIKNKQFGKNEH
jgi:hypothetical protein